MIDARRWIVVEAWLSCGLRIDWHHGYREVPESQWMGNEGAQYYYDGLGCWLVRSPYKHRYSPYGVNPGEAPSLPTDDMKHELAHWLVASEEQRNQINFGMNDKSYDLEQRAVDAEKAIDAVLRAASTISNMALEARGR